MATGELDRQRILRRKKASETGEPSGNARPAAVSAETLVRESNELKNLRQQFVNAFANAPKAPEVEFNPTVKSALFLLHGADVLSLFERQPGNVVGRLSLLSDANKIAEQLFLRIFSRRPTDEERTHAVQFLEKNKKSRTVAIGQLAWAMLASTEFCLNH